MRVVLLLLCLCGGGDDFQWKTGDGFTWTVTNRSAPESATFRFGKADGQGACIHIGNGFFVTARHIGQGRGDQFKIDGEVVAAQYRYVTNRDFAVFRCREKRDLPHVEWSNQLPEIGDKLTVYARKTGRTSGTVAGYYTDGSLRVEFDKGQPCTESGDSGSGVFDQSGRLVAIHLGSQGRSERCMPLHQVKSILASPVGGEQVSAPSTGGTKAKSQWLFFTAPWCGPCREAHAYVDAMLADGEDVMEINTDTERSKANEHRVDHIPTWIKIENGREVFRMSGKSDPRKQRQQ